MEIKFFFYRKTHKWNEEKTDKIKKIEKNRKKWQK